MIPYTCPICSNKTTEKHSYEFMTDNIDLYYWECSDHFYIYLGTAGYSFRLFTLDYMITIKYNQNEARIIDQNTKKYIASLPKDLVIDLLNNNIFWDKLPTLLNFQ